MPADDGLRKHRFVCVGLQYPPHPSDPSTSCRSIHPGKRNNHSSQLVLGIECWDGML